MGATCECCDSTAAGFGPYRGQGYQGYNGQSYAPGPVYNPVGGGMYNPMTIRGSLVDTVAGLATPTIPPAGYPQQYGGGVPPGAYAPRNYY